MNLKSTIEQIKADEGLKLKPYFCTANKLTIGYGRNIEQNGISELEAELLLSNDVHRSNQTLMANFTWFSKLDNARKSVLINMLFNLGLPTFLQFKKMLAAIESKDFSEAANQMRNSKWAKQVGKRAERLAIEMEYPVY